MHRKSPSPVKQTLLTGLAVMSVDNADTAARAASTSDTGQLWICDQWRHRAGTMWPLSISDSRSSSCPRSSMSSAQRCEILCYIWSMSGKHLMLMLRLEGTTAQTTNVWPLRPGPGADCRTRGTWHVSRTRRQQAADRPSYTPDSALESSE